MTKVMVIGNAGGGKSTMCTVLCAAHKLPLYAIDSMQWQPGWRETPAEEYNHAHDALIAQDRWLLDGYGPWGSVLKRMDAADTIIIVDLPLWIHYWWATKRQIKSIFVGRPDGPPGCAMWPVTFKLYKMMWWLHKVQRPLLLKEVQKRSNEKRFVHIKSPAALRVFVQNSV